MHTIVRAETDAVSPVINFEFGNYAAVAEQEDHRIWQPAAALALMGHTRRAITELVRFKTEESRFHLAVAHWMDGKEKSHPIASRD